MKKDESKHLEKRITFGFKIMSGFYSKGISKIDVDNLTSNQSVHWETTEIDTVLNDMGIQLVRSQFFKFWSSWNTSMVGAMSDAIALNFLLVMREDWDRKNRPKNPSSTEHKQFTKNALILFDRSVYEYVMRKWRGSSDSKIGANIAEVRGSSDLFEPVSHVDWERLVGEMLDAGTIDGQAYVSGKKFDTRVKPLLYYYYVINEICGPDVQDPNFGGVDVDHIIPQSAFSSTPRDDLKCQCNAIYNLALLPHKPNISKSDQKIKDVDDAWLIQQIVKYEEIPQSSFDRYSDVSQINDLKDSRGAKIRETFLSKRKRLIDD